MITQRQAKMQNFKTANSNTDSVNNLILLFEVLFWQARVPSPKSKPSPKSNQKGKFGSFYFMSKNSEGGRWMCIGECESVASVSLGLRWDVRCVQWMVPAQPRRRGLKMFAGTWLRLLAWIQRGELRPLAASLPSSAPGPDTDHPQYTTHQTPAPM